MTQNPFKVGDRVKPVCKSNLFKTGTVIGFYRGVAYVKWDNFRGGHNCGGRLTGFDAASGWNFLLRDLVLAEECEPVSVNAMSIL